MGRSGSGGGGGRSGGGFSSGGGRFSGGFSGGGRGGRSGGPSFGGEFRGPQGPQPGPWGPPPRRSGGSFWGGFLAGSLLNRRRPVVIDTRGAGGPGGGNGPGGPSGNGGGGTSGCAGGCAVLLLAIVALAVILAIGGGMPSCSRGYTQQSASAVVREELPAGAVTETAYYTDEDGTWIDDPGQLESGLKAFFDKTGVQPYVYILPNGQTTSTSELTTQAEALYDRLFSDEGHFLLVFCDDGNGSYNCGYAVGSLAAGVMDDEAIGILAEQLERAYNDYSLTEEEIFSQAFERTADLIMGAAESQQASRTAGTVAVAVVVVAAVGGVAYVVVRRKRTRERERREQAEKILNTPLETFGDSDIEDLADKYEDDAGK